MAKKKKRPAAPPPPVRKAPPRPAGSARVAGAAQAARAKSARTRDADALRRRLTTAGLVAVVLAAAVGWYLYDRSRDAELTQALTSGSCEVDDETDPTGPPGQNHVNDPSYAVNPPSGGDHLPSAARSGVYAGDRLPPDGQLVHSLEHGYVVYWHAPDLPEDQVRELERLKEERQGDVIVAERAGMPVPVAATAWGRRLLCGEVEPDALDRFAQEHVGDGPEDVPRG